MPSLKQRLAAGELTVGSWITLAHPAIAEIMARAGFDWLVADMEHSAIDMAGLQELIRTIGLAGTPPLVRLTSNDPALIKRAMDAGAHGIVVPMVESRADAEAAVAATYYPPRGRRGVGLARAQGYGASFPAYREWLEREAVVIIQIEHIGAVEDIDAILAVEGVDGFIVGPYDLSASMGMPGLLDHPDVEAAIARVREAGARAGKPGGLHVVEPDRTQIAVRIAEGFRFLAYSLDIRILDTVCRADLAHIRAL